MNTFAELPANKNSLAQRKPVYGHGINDANYMVCQKIDGKQVMCPYYMAWTNMIERCYSDKYQSRQLTYISCSVEKEWLTFSAFKAWMKKQDWNGKQLDKDILVAGNKVYGPNACLFVSSAINKLLTDRAAKRGDLPQGMSFNKHAGRYVARCNVNGRLKHLGYFKTIPEAELTYLEFKSDLITKIANESEALSNPKLHDALLVHAGLFLNKAAKIGVQL